MRRTLFGFLIAASAALAPAWAAGGEREDAQIARQIAITLRDSGKFQNFSIGVKYSQGTVWLNGRVTSKQQMIAAVQIVSDLRGVHKVVNSLSVGQARDGSNGPGNPGQRRPAGPASQNPGVQMAGANMPMPVRRGPGGGVPAGYSTLDDGDQYDGEQPSGAGNGRPLPAYMPGAGGGTAPATYDKANLPNHAWPSYAAYPNYAAVSYPKQYSPTAWPFIGPFYPYPQVPLGWRKVSLEWHDGWWFLDFNDRGCQ